MGINTNNERNKHQDKQTQRQTNLLRSNESQRWAGRAGQAPGLVQMTSNRKNKTIIKTNRKKVIEKQVCIYFPVYKLTCLSIY